MILQQCLLAQVELRCVFLALTVKREEEQLHLFSMGQPQCGKLQKQCSYLKTKIAHNAF
jgi:hypothetical protein